ncbi:MAG: NUDIX domain-containing protein [candidate division FCPU426 bacterium]
MKRLPRIRVAGVAVKGDCLLLVRHRRDGREYYLLPGGGLEWGETCAEGLAREFMEELSLRVSVGRLLCVNESLEPRGRRHILNLTFHVRLRGGRLRVNRDRRLQGACWVKRKDLGRLTFYPEIRRTLIQAWNRRFQGGARLVETPWT